jgi:hypothetical protein
LDVWFENDKGERLTHIMCGDNVSIKIAYERVDAEERLNFLIGIYNPHGQRALRFDTRVDPVVKSCFGRTGIATCKLQSPFPLYPGCYMANVSILGLRGIADYLVNAASFEVVPGDFFGTGKLYRHEALFLVPNQWMIERS